MGFIKSSRLEYIKQPHIAALIILSIAVISAAVFTGIQRVKEISGRASMSTFQACQEMVNDDVLCNFAVKHEEQSKDSYIIASTVTDGETTEVNTTEVESPDRLKSVTLRGIDEIEAYIVIDDTTYVKDYNDGVWAMYKDPEFTASEADKVAYDFSSASSQDVVEFRDQYSNEGQEPCGDLTCYKYKVTNVENASITDYVWIDTKDYRLRRHMSVEGDLTTNSQFKYQAVSIAAPSPTKEVSPEDMEDYLGLEEE